MAVAFAEAISETKAVAIGRGNISGNGEVNYGGIEVCRCRSSGSDNEGYNAGNKCRAVVMAVANDRSKGDGCDGVGGGSCKWRHSGSCASMIGIRMRVILINNINNAFCAK